MSSSKVSHVRKALAVNVMSIRKSKSSPRGKSWTQAYLATVSDVSLGTIQKIEAGSSWPDWKTVLKISSALDVCVDTLYGESENGVTLESALDIVNESMGINLQSAGVPRKLNSGYQDEEKVVELFSGDEKGFKGILELSDDILKELSTVYKSKKRELVLRAMLGLDVSEADVNQEWGEKSTNTTLSSSSLVRG